MLFKAMFSLTILLVLGATALVGGRFLGLIDATPAAASTVCDSLSASQRKALVGEKTPYAAEETTPDRKRVSCRWTIEEGADDTLVEVTSMDAGAWVVEFASDTADGSAGDAARQEVRRRALDLGTGASDREACALAAKVFELDGAARGAQRGLVFKDGGKKSSPRLVAQSCTASTFTRVVAAAPDLKNSATLERRATEALRQVQELLS